MTLEARWDAELERRGITAVAAFLASPQSVAPYANAQFHLFVRDLQDPPRSYVEGWLARKEAAAAEVAERRHRETVEPARAGARWAFWAFIAGIGAAALSLIALFK